MGNVMTRPKLMIHSGSSEATFHARFAPSRTTRRLSEAYWKRVLLLIKADIDRYMIL